MELEILRKKISSYRTEGGHLKKVSEELMIEVLMAWEQWTGPVQGFYSAIGVNKYSLAKLIGNAKKLKRNGFPTDGFKELKVVSGGGEVGPSQPCNGIELKWNERLIRFPEVDQLVDFLKKAA